MSLGDKSIAEMASKKSGSAGYKSSGHIRNPSEDPRHEELAGAQADPDL
jgi:hypothetical protein